MLQLPSSAASVDGDHPRPLAIGAVRDLLVKGPDHAVPVLQRMIPGADPVLAVAPEYTFGSGDWADIDAPVQAVTRPIILLAGFGETIGQSVLVWQAAGAGEATQRHLGWREADGAISISSGSMADGAGCMCQTKLRTVLPISSRSFVELCGANALIYLLEPPQTVEERDRHRR